MISGGVSVFAIPGIVSYNEVSEQNIIKGVQSYYGVNVFERTNEHRVSIPRSIVIYFLKFKLNLGGRAIEASMKGCVKRSNCVQAYMNVSNRMTVDAEFKKTIDEIWKCVKNIDNIENYSKVYLD